MKYYIVESNSSYGLFGRPTPICVFQDKKFAEFYKYKKERDTAPYSGIYHFTFYSIREVELIDPTDLFKDKQFKKFCQERIKKLEEEIQENIEEKTKTINDRITENEKLVKEKLEVEEYLKTL